MAYLLYWLLNQYLLIVMNHIFLYFSRNPKRDEESRVQGTITNSGDYFFFFMLIALEKGYLYRFCSIFLFLQIFITRYGISI